MSDLLEPILARKRREIARRHGHRGLFDPARARRGHAPLPALEALKRTGPLPRIIAEVKLASPSEGRIRAWRPGEVLRVARSYEASGAAAVSVLCDRAGFGGSVLDLRRVAREVRLPALFKEFVLDPIQVDLARAAGASMVLLLVRALSDAALSELVRACLDRGLEPVVEAASADEVERALRTEARVVGVNARDLATFRVDPAVAAAAIQKIPENRVAVYMSGVSSPEELSRVAKGRADAVLIGTALVRASDPGARLRELVEGAGPS
ncbi:MAG: indole-3-glycerol phosphate synthase TrpC [Sandaracinaceae bacterium]|nr:indole-3-glycerol phosphate synthase TrpC [Sandaracinaceae bacterium]